jgi:hypothetical protein
MAHRRWEAHSRLSARPQTSLRFVIRFPGSLRSPPREGGLSASSSEYAGQVQSPPFLRYACCRLRLRPQSSGRPTRLHKEAVEFSAVNRASSFPLSRSQTRSVWSLDVETARRPSGVMTTPCTESLWPLSVRTLWPLSRSQTRPREATRRLHPIGSPRGGVEMSDLRIARA